MSRIVFSAHPRHVRNRRITAAIFAGLLLMIGWLAIGSGSKKEIVRPKAVLHERSRISSVDRRYDAVLVEEPVAGQPSFFRILVVAKGDHRLDQPFEAQFDAEPRLEWLAPDQLQVTLATGHAIDFANVVYVDNKPDQRVEIRLRDVGMVAQ